MDEQIKKMICVCVYKHINKNLALKYVIHTYNIIKPLKENEILPCAITWMDLESIMLNKSDREREIVHDLIQMWNRKKTNLSGAAGMRPVRDKVMGRERNLKGSSSSLGAAPGAQYVPSGADGTRKKPAGSRTTFPSRLSRGPGVSLSSFCLTVVGLSINFWKYNI